MLTLLFSEHFQVLGEFLFEKGKLHRFSLSKDGERRLGSQVAHWQTLGIELIERLSREEKGVATYTLARRHIILSSPEAEAAFLCWAADIGNITISLPERLLPYWEKLCTLPLEPEERFASLQAIRHAPHRLVEAWEKAIDQLVHTPVRT